MRFSEEVGDMATTKTPVILSGPGNMGKRLGAQILKSEDFTLVPWALTKTSTEPIDIEGGIRLRCVPLSERPSFNLRANLPPNAIVLDFTKADSTAIVKNIDYYATNGVKKMVIGTTGMETVMPEVSRIITGYGMDAVIEANFCAQMVGLGFVIEKFAKENEGGMKGDTIQVFESHQPPKPDPSGTAIKLSKSFGKLGIEGCPFDGDDIKQNPGKYRDSFVMIRNKLIQLEVLGVPVEHIGGHGWHTYIITQRAVSGTAFGQLHRTISSFMKNSPVFDGFTKTEYEEAKDHKKGTLIERKSKDKNVLFKTILRYDPDSYGKTPVLQLVVTHNMSGRDMYKPGVMQALRFQRDMVETGRISSMVDVLRLDKV